jgi:hypothetical protein
VVVEKTAEYSRRPHSSLVSIFWTYTTLINVYTGRKHTAAPIGNNDFLGCFASRRQESWHGSASARCSSFSVFSATPNHIHIKFPDQLSTFNHRQRQKAFSHVNRQQWFWGLPMNERKIWKIFIYEFLDVENNSFENSTRIIQFQCWTWLVQQFSYDLLAILQYLVKLALSQWILNVNMIAQCQYDFGQCQLLKVNVQTLTDSHTVTKDYNN